MELKIISQNEFVWYVSGIIVVVVKNTANTGHQQLKFPCFEIIHTNFQAQASLFNILFFTFKCSL